MKKFKSLVLAVIGLLCSMSVSAHDFEVDGIYYNITSSTDKTVEVTYRDFYLNEYSGAVTIPESVTCNGKTYSVTSIGYRAFEDCSGLTSVVIPNSVTSIGVLAFYDCSGLTSVVIPNSVISIGSSVFYDCSGLTSVVISNSVTSIEDNTFRGCSGLASVVIPESVTSIGAGAFYDCSGLTSVVIPESVTSIGSGAFSGCSGLTSVVIPESVTSIGDNAFGLCYSLTSVVIGNSVTSIGDWAFSSCSGLNSVIIGNSVTSIGDWAFSHCYSLTSVVIPESVTSIGDNAFFVCSGLTSVLIGNSVTSIGDNAFSSCDSLTTVVIPESVTSIGPGAFYGCSGLTSVLIGNSVTSIGDNAFDCCYSLTSVVIGKSVNNIGDWAFSNCLGLTSVVIPESVTSIGDNAFDCCYSLTSIVVAEGNKVYDSRENCNAIIESETNTLIAGCKNTNIPNSVTSIGSSAFSGCYSLTSVVIPESVTSIGSSAFYRCVDLTSITSLNQTPPTIYSSTFSEYDVTLYVPYGAKSTYSTAEHWKNFTNIVELKPSFDLTVTTVGYATLYLDYATEIPAGVEVYTAKEVDGNRLKMLQIENVLPANTGAIVKAPAGTYTFAYSDTEVSAIENNLFKGSSVDEYINVPANASAFVLSMVEGEVGMYLAKLTDGCFLNNANKVYLLLDNNKLGLSDEELDTSVGGAQLSLRFDFGGATGVDKVQTETSMNNATYDMYGRKVNNITTPGLYIVNGKKVLVK